MAKKSCAHKKSDMTPCVITDGPVAYCEDSRSNPICVGCERPPEATGVKPPKDWDELVGGNR